MPDHVATVTGESGSPVLLIAGGASSSHGFFPGLEEALEGHRVISLDRPGAGRALRLGEATLPSGAAAAARAIEDVGAGPAVVVAQSLGGAVAVQLAADRPDLVAGMVLIDPTPLDLPGQITLARRIFTVLGAPGRLPVVGPRVDRFLFRALGRDHKLTPQTEPAFEVMTTSAPLHATGRAIRTFTAEGEALLPRLRPLDVPVVILTAERKPGHEVRASHDRLAAALGGRIVAPAGAVHADHLRDPDGVNALVLEVVEAARR